MILSAHDRADAFAEFVGAESLAYGCGFVKGISVDEEQTIYATWRGGQDYTNKGGIYGAYPRSYLERAMMLFPDAGRILHLFSGSLTAEQVEQARVDAFGAQRVCPKGWRPSTDGNWGPMRCANCGWPKEGHAGACVQVRFDNALHPAAAAADPDAVGDAQKLQLVLDAAELVRIIAVAKHEGLPPPVKLGRAEDNDPRAVELLRTALNAPFDVVLADSPYRLADQRRYWRESMWALIGLCARCQHSAVLHEPHYQKSTHAGVMLCPRKYVPVKQEFEHPDYVRFKPLNKKTVVHECAKVLAPGGWLVWLDESIPMYSKSEWISRGAISVWRSTNHRIRGALLLERRA